MSEQVQSGPNHMNPTGLPRHLVLWLLAVTLVSAVPRAWGVWGGLTYDESHYAEAARMGVVANAVDQEPTYWLRHNHPSLSAHLMTASLRALGHTELAIRMPSLLASLALVPLLGLFLGRVTGNRQASVLASLLLVTMPAHTLSAKVGDHHALVILFMLTGVLSLGIAVAENSRKALVLSGIALGLLVATSEFGAVVAGVCLLILVLLPNPFITLLRAPRKIDRVFLQASALAVVIPIVLWPAGLFRMGMYRSLRRYTMASLEARLGISEVQTAPLTVYLEQYAEIAPGYLLLFVPTLVLALGFLMRRKLPKALVPAAVLMVFLTVVMHTQWPAAFRYSLYAATFLVLFAAWLLGELLRTRPVSRVVVVPFVAGLLVLSAPTALRLNPPAFAYREAASFLETAAPDGGRILSTSPQILAFYLDRIGRAGGRPEELPWSVAFKEPEGWVRTVGPWVIEQYSLGELRPRELQALREGHYDWIVTEPYRRQVHPDDPAHEFLRADTHLWSSTPVDSALGLEIHPGHRLEAVHGGQ